MTQRHTDEITQLNARLKAHLLRNMPEPGLRETAVEGFRLSRRNDVGNPEHCFYKPMVSITIQGIKLSISLASMQTEAVRSAATHKVSVITGGPGTGKTTSIRAILHIFAHITRKILLAAPTGRTAKRMSETTGLEAKTIHRLLEYNMALGGFQKNEEHQLDADIVILDEASMIDLILMHHLSESQLAT